MHIQIKKPYAKESAYYLDGTWAWECLGSVDGFNSSLERKFQIGMTDKELDAYLRGYNGSMPRTLMRNSKPIRSIISF